MVINLRSTHIGMPKQGMRCSYSSSYRLNAQPCTILQRCRPPVRLRLRRDDPLRLSVRKHRRDTCRALDAHSVTDLTQPSNKLANFRRPGLQRVTHSTVAPVIAPPAPAGLLGANTVVIHPDDVAKLLLQAWLGRCGIHIALALYFCTALLVAQKEEVKRIQVACVRNKVTSCFIRKIFVLSRTGEVLL